jgi:hypothetical protein
VITGPGLRTRDGTGREPQAPGGAEPGPHDGAGPEPGLPGWLARQVQALFAQARRRRRRRWLITAAAALALAVLASATVIGYRAAGRPGPGAARPGAPVPASAPRFTLPVAFVAWFDANGTLRIGNVATLTQRAVARVADPPCCTLIAAGHRIYWAGQSGHRDYVQEYDLATGVLRNVAPGWAVFSSASGRDIYIAQSGRRLLVLPADGSGPARPLVTPPGWQVVPLPWAVTGGILLGSDGQRPAIGVWQPGVGHVRVIGHGHVMTAWTSPSRQGSLIAWQPAACPQRCPVEITSIPAGRTLTVRSPLPYGFLGQGGDMAFSPDGTELAALISVSPPNPDTAERFMPALVNTATGTVRLVRRAILANGEFAGWLVWLPGAGRLLAGPAADIGRYAGYAIDARTAAARPFTFFPGSSYLANAPGDITYGAVLVPRSAAAPAP